MALISDSVTITLLAVLGAYLLLSRLISFIRLLSSLFVLPGQSLYKAGDKGTWAIVTGASDGLGREYALQLASKGFNILLISRTRSKLEALATDISKMRKPVKTAILPIDFSENNDRDYDSLRRDIADKTVAILVNNVGVSHLMPVPFSQTEDDEMVDIITVNCLATLRVTKTVLPNMLRHKRGLILTMASFAGLTPTPLLATYSGSKAFLQNWSTALGAELTPHGIDVQLVQSYLVASAMSKIRRTSAMIPSPRQFVRSALGKLGRSGGAQGVAFTSTPYWSQALMQWGLSTFLGEARGFVVRQNMVMHEGIRARALRKAEREAKRV